VRLTVGGDCERRPDQSKPHSSAGPQPPRRNLLADRLDLLLVVEKRLDGAAVLGRPAPFAVAIGIGCVASACSRVDPGVRGGTARCFRGQGRVAGQSLGRHPRRHPERRGVVERVEGPGRQFVQFDVVGAGHRQVAQRGRAARSVPVA